MWSRSVKSRSPSLVASTRAATPLSDQTFAQNPTVLWASRVSAHLKSWSCTWLSFASSAASSSATVQPKNHESAAARARVGSAGRVSAVRSQRHCVAAADRRTLSLLVTTAGIAKR